MATARFTQSHRIPAALRIRIAQILNTGTHDAGDMLAEPAAHANTLLIPPPDDPVDNPTNSPLSHNGAYHPN